MNTYLCKILLVHTEKAHTIILQIYDLIFKIARKYKSFWFNILLPYFR